MFNRAALARSETKPSSRGIDRDKGFMVVARREVRRTPVSMAHTRSIALWRWALRPYRRLSPVNMACARPKHHNHWTRSLFYRLNRLLAGVQETGYKK